MRIDSNFYWIKIICSVIFVRAPFSLFPICVSMLYSKAISGLSVNIHCDVEYNWSDSVAYIVLEEVDVDADHLYLVRFLWWWTLIWFWTDDAHCYGFIRNQWLVFIVRLFHYHFKGNQYMVKLKLGNLIFHCSFEYLQFRWLRIRIHRQFIRNSFCKSQNINYQWRQMYRNLNN